MRFRVLFVSLRAVTFALALTPVAALAAPAADLAPVAVPAVEAVERAVAVAPVPAVEPALAAPAAVQDAAPQGFEARADAAMGRVNSVIASVFFFDLLFWTDDARLPLVVAWLVVAAIYLTIRMGFVNFRAFRHAIQITRGEYTNPDEPGDVSHFQALSTALSATVGLGNIAGVAIAVSVGGPGATFWMIVAGLLGMSTKFSECSLGQMYREIGRDGRVLGGPMQYLSKGFAEKNMAGLGRFLAVLFAILCIGGSMGGGNSFQVNQSLNAIQETIPFLNDYAWVYGLGMTILVAVVILGGITRIATTAGAIVPLMAIVYVVASLAVIFTNLARVPSALAAIFGMAMSPGAAYGGFIGVLVIGFQRAAFSNEAGAGSAVIAHSAARTQYPIREGMVSLLEPFIDTVCICTMTALVIVFSGAYENPAYADLVASNSGAALTSRAFGEHIPFFPYILSFSVFLFAFSTMISWSYYGERCAVWLFGEKASLPYKLLFLAFVFLGSIITATQVLEFGDLMILGMAFPNLLGVYVLSGKVRKELDSYWADYKAGKFPTFRPRSAE